MRLTRRSADVGADAPPQLSLAVGHRESTDRTVKILKVNGVDIEARLVDGLEGYYLCRLSDWSKDVASVLAAQDDLILGSIHLCILNEFRKYYDEFQCFPSKKALNERIIYNCQISYEEFMKLFPKGLHQAARISGIALPTGYGNMF